MSHLARCAALLVVVCAALTGCAEPPTREYTAVAESGIGGDVTWVLLIDGEVTDRGVVRIGSTNEQPFRLPVQQGQQVSFTVGVVGTGWAECKVDRVADGAQVVAPVRQEPQVDRAPEKSPPATCSFVA